MIDVSIIIPVYNSEDSLGRTLDSILAQTHRNIEIIIINDGSKDKSQDIIDNYANMDPRIKTVTIPNSGVSGARNKGIEMAEGKYLFFVDADDTVPPKAVSHLYNRAEKKGADLTIGIMERVSTISSRKYVYTVILGHKGNIKKNDKALIYSLSTCNKLFKKKIIDDYNLRFKDIKHTEDGVFTFEYISKCNKIVGCPKVVYNYIIPLTYQRESLSATHVIKADMLNEFIKAFNCLVEISKDKDEKFKETLYKRAFTGTLLPFFYRKIWFMDEKMKQGFFEKLYEYKNKLSNQSFSKIAKRNFDLDIEKNFEIEKTFVDFYIKDLKTSEDMFTTLQSIYGQDSPLFSITVDEKLKSLIPENYMAFSNLKIGTAKDLSAEYMIVVDKAVIYNENTIKLMLKSIKKADAVVAGSEYKWESGKMYKKKSFGQSNLKVIYNKKAHVIYK